MLFFTSDLHFGHTNVIKYSNRPYQNADEMNLDLVKRFNSRVQPTDTTYFLGDISFRKQCIPLLNQMNGKKFLIKGNHDSHSIKDLEPYFEWIKDYFELKANSTLRPGHVLLVMMHYPIARWNHQHHGSLHLFGHSHGSYQSDKKCLDVGVDTHDWYPYSLNEIETILAPKAIGTHHE